MTYAEPVNMTGLSGVFKYANDVSEGVFGVGILISLYLIIFIYLKMKEQDTSNCFIVAGFITTIMAIFLFAIELIIDWHLYLSIFMMALPVIWTFFNRE